MDWEAEAKDRGECLFASHQREGALVKLLKRAIDTVEQYELDIRNRDDLQEFCQGRFYQHNGSAMLRAAYEDMNHPADAAERDQIQKESYDG